MDERILAWIREKGPVSAREIADGLGVERREVNRRLYGPLNNRVRNTGDFAWAIAETTSPQSDSATTDGETERNATDIFDVDPAYLARLRSKLNEKPAWELSDLAAALGDAPAVVQKYLESDHNDFAEQNGTQWSLMLSAQEDIGSAERLHRLRLKLLDLSRRNPLLNYKHPKGRSVRVIDEVPNQLYEELISGNAFLVDSLPKVPTGSGVSQLKAEARQLVEESRPSRPSHAKWAEAHGIPADFTLLERSQESRHRDHKLQTLQFPEELSTRLKTMAGLARTAIEESGANILYLAFGFMEWKEPSSSDVNLAPLILLPVTLTKKHLTGSSTLHQYILEYSGEDVQANLSLREKLKEFNLELPDLEDGQSPSEYFKACTRLCREQEDWRVLPYVTLGFFQFGKLLMYLDLDPERWPGNRDFRKHRIISKILRGEIEGGGGTIPDYQIDDVPLESPEALLVEQADGSQHTALIDALKGKDLVIDGPPGTGKSQTITNIIASAMAADKTVLFVSEKLAALEVVRSNLQRAGLGEFCLELHSHRTQKKRFFVDLADRMELDSAPVNQVTLIRIRREYQERRDRIRAYLEAVNQTVSGLGITRQQLFCELAGSNGVAGDLLANVAGAPAPPQQANLVAALDAIKVAADALATARAAFIAQYGAIESCVLAPLLPKQEAVEAEWRGILGKWRDEASTLEGIERGFLDDSGRLNAFDLKQLSGVLEHIAVDDRAMLRFDALAEPADAWIEECLRAENRLADLRSAATKTFDLTVGQERALVAAVSPLCDTLKTAPVQGLEALSLEQLEELTTNIELIARSVPELADPVSEVEGHFSVAWPTSDDRLGLCALILEAAAFAPLHALAERTPLMEAISTTEPLVALRNTQQSLKKRRAMLGLRFCTVNENNGDQLLSAAESFQGSGWFPYFDPGYRGAAGVYRNQCNGRAWLRGRKRKATDLVELAEFQADQTAFLKDRSAFELLGQSFCGLDTPLNSHIELVTWYGVVRDRFGTRYDVRGDLGRQLLRLEADVLSRIAGSQGRDLAQRLAPISAAVARIKEISPEVAQWLFKETWAQVVPSASRLHEALAPVAAEFRLKLKNHAAVLADATRILEDYVARLDDEQRQYVRDTLLVSGLPDVLSDKHLAVLTKLKEAEVKLSRFDGASVLRAVFAAWHPNCADRWNAAAERLADGVSKFEMAESQVRRECEVVEARLPSGSLRAMPVARAADWLGHVISDGARIDAWLAIGSQLNEIVDQRRGAEALRIGVFSEVDMDALGHAINYLAKQPIAEQEIASTPLLGEFSTEKHETVLKEFRHLDARLKEQDREYVRANLLKRTPPAGSGRGGRVGNLTEMALLEHQIGLQQRHQPLRAVVRRAGQALQALKPCFMMGPLSVAQYLAPGKIHFDLVVFDEASQVRPEDALGAIARGSQVIVVGDPRQLPPTNFFNTLVGDDDEDDSDNEYVFANQESILDIAQKTLGRSLIRTLNWHYRSRHERLIAFSNSRFYKSRLHVFPTAEPGSEDKGLHLRYVNDGRYEGQGNVPEAQALVREAIDHIQQYPDRSLGIVAMNSTQARIISDEFDAVCAARGIVRSEDDDDTLNRVFIKNLENVQGDERDVMLISLTYGPDPKGHVYNRFGPINREGGWRRLNVLFTRAKEKMVVFSSMRSSQIALADVAKEGAQALKSFLEYAESGILRDQPDQGTRPPDSEFELDVARAVMAHGLDVRCQVGEAGFYIDLGVVDPHDTERYLLGIECDGAPYHSNRSVRERDRIRQEILEGYGWKIHRIWSTDWYRRNDAERQRLAGVLRDAATEAQARRLAREEESVTGGDVVVGDSTPNQAEIATESVMSPEAESPSSLDDAIRMRLRNFRELIRETHPDTPPEKMLLRDEMIEALVEHQPLTPGEFTGYIPGELRTATDSDEARAYLGAVLALIDKLL